LPVGLALPPSEDRISKRPPGLTRGRSFFAFQSPWNRPWAIRRWSA